MNNKINTAEEVSSQIKSWAALFIAEKYLSADATAQYAVSALYEIFDHILLMKINHPNAETAFSPEYILQRFKDFAKMWAKTKLDCNDQEEIVVEINSTPITFDSESANDTN
jgi:hypothetical protein